jgi:hypothetical protein
MKIMDYGSVPMEKLKKETNVILKLVSVYIYTVLLMTTSMLVVYS